MKLIYPAKFYTFNDGKGYTVEFPDLPGCITQGDDLQEAFEMAEDAAAGWILTSIEEGESIPNPSKTSEYNNCSFVNYICIDISEYSKKHSSKSVKKTLTIPQWLNTLAENASINFSRILQKGILEELKIDVPDRINLNEQNTKEHEEIISKMDNLSDSFNALNQNFAISNVISMAKLTKERSS